MSGKREPFRKTSSIYSHSTIPVQNIELPITAEICSKYYKDQNFQQISFKPNHETNLLTTTPNYPKKNRCEKYKCKNICVNVEEIPIMKTKNLNICRQRPKPCKQTEEMLKFRSTFCKKNSRFSLPSESIDRLNQIEKLLKKDQKKIITTGKRIPVSSNNLQINSKLKAPCPASIYGDDLKNKYIGKCIGKNLNKRLPHEKNIKYDFTLTEDPRQVHCLNNPYFKDKKIDFSEKVKLADNISTDNSTENLTISVCEEIDLENPYNLDFQGIDYQVCYENDEQNFQNVREYRIIKRYRDRRATKKLVADTQAKKLLESKFAIPEFYNTNYLYHENNYKSSWTNPEIVNEPVIEEYKLAKIYRTPEKKFNKTLTEFEVNQRKGRYLNLYLARTELEKEQEKLNEEIQIREDEEKVLTIGQNLFENAMNQEVVNNIEELQHTLAPEKGIRRYPHNLKETKRLRHKMKKSKLIIREKAKVREDFLRQLGKNRIIEEAHIEFSDLSPTQSSISEQSTDEEDNLIIGPIDNKYQLRGFHYDLGTKIRGKLQNKELDGSGKLVQGCMTRNEWFQTIQPDKKTDAFYSYNPPPVPLFQDPNDTNLALFPPKPLQPNPIEQSPVNEIINQPIGMQYLKSIVKNLNIKKPKTIKVKKFNLTGYMYGTIHTNKLNIHNESELSSNAKNIGFGGLMEYIYSKLKQNKLRKRRKRHQRMHYLGIPFNQTKLNKRHQPCIHSSTSENSDWIPNDDLNSDRNTIALVASLMNFGRSHVLSLQKDAPKVESHPETLIPAPDFREPTVRCNYYENFLNDPQNLDKPYLFPPEDNKRIEPNLDSVKKNYMKVLEARHHHDHIDPTQHKYLNAKYLRKSPKLKIEKYDNNNNDDDDDDDDIDNNNKKNFFDKAIPDRIKLRDIDLTIPKVYDNINNDIDSNDELISKELNFNQYDINNEIENNGFYHSLDEPPKQFDGHQKFIQLIDDMLKEIKRQQLAKGISDEEEEIIDKDAYLNELNDELLSIKSCLSSLSSSVCTNFTNDSGSYLMIQDKKVPMDYIRKSLVPFVELNRVRVKAEERKRFIYNTNPFISCPFAGQLKEQTMQINDKFHTFKTRISNDIRARLHVPTEELKNQLLGVNNKEKHHPLVATDLDEIYINELHNRPPVKIFKPKSTMLFVKDALRKKYVCWSIQQKIVELKAAQETELHYYEEIIKLKELLIQLFQKWEKEYYEASMQTLSKVKPYYELTDKMKKNMVQLEQTHLSLNMEIIMIEDDFRRRTILQNFHYLIMKNSWREKNDWIHLNNDGELENYRDSIQKRYIVNVRPRDRDDAWLIKEYYENVYLKNLHPIVIVFPDANSFIGGIDSLKSKTFVCLLELHFAMWVWTTLEQKLNHFLNWSREFLLKQTKFVKTKCSKKYFMEDRQNFLKHRTTLLMNIPLAQSIATYDMRLFMATCDVVYEKIVPLNIRISVKDDIDVVDKTALLWDTILDIFNEIDAFPRELFTSIELSYRRRYKYKLRMSKQACQIEKRIFLSMEEVKRNLAPPFVKPKREGKLPRLFLPQKETKEPPPAKVLSEKTKFFYYAFHDDNELLPSSEDLRDSMEVLGDIHEENVPFHFDHFLRINDYIPNYNFKTQIEITDGPEENYFKCREVLPDIFLRLQQWEQAKQAKMEHDIKKYAHMYENVKI